MKKNIIFVIIIYSVVILSSCQKEYIIKTNEYTACIDIKYGKEKRQKLDVYFPNNKKGTVGLILMIHPGGWITGDKEVFENDLIKWSKELGYVASAINYRYASKNSNIDEILDDVTMALEKIKYLAIEYDINIEKVILHGGSAGGHISLLYGYMKKNVAPIKPVAISSLSGPTDLTDSNYFKSDNPYLNEIINMFNFVSGYEFGINDLNEVLPYLSNISPINYVNDNSIPTIICHGALDEVVPVSNAITLDEVLTKNNVEHKLIIYPNSGHRLENDCESSDYANQLLIDYAKRYLQ